MIKQFNISESIWLKIFQTALMYISHKWLFVRMKNSCAKTYSMKYYASKLGKLATSQWMALTGNENPKPLDKL